MKLRCLGQADSNDHNPIETLGTEYKVLFWGKNVSLIPFMLNLISFSQLIIRILLNGYKPQIRQGRDREQNLYWYAYYPLSDTSKLLASEAEIKQLIELTQEI